MMTTTKIEINETFGKKKVLMGRLKFLSYVVRESSSSSSSKSDLNIHKIHNVKARKKKCRFMIMLSKS